MSLPPLSIITPWHYQTQWKLQVLGVLISGWHHSNLFTVISADGGIMFTSSSEHYILRHRPYVLVGFCTWEFRNFTSSISILHTSLRKPNVAGSRRHCGDAGLPCLWGTRRKWGREDVFHSPITCLTREMGDSAVCDEAMRRANKEAVSKTNLISSDTAPLQNKPVSTGPFSSDFPLP